MLFIAAIVLITVIASERLPIGPDWTSIADAVHHARQPFAQPGYFIGPPWELGMAPHALLPLPIGNAINMLITLGIVSWAVIASGGDLVSLALVLTSPALIGLLATNNLDWVPLVGVLIGPAFGPVLILSKPQSAAGILVVWIKRHGIRILWPVAALLALSLLAWGWWPGQMPIPTQSIWNVAPWPWMIPAGIYLLWRAWQTDDDVLGAIATPFLVPYIGWYSLTVPMALASGKYKREVFFLWLTLWWFVIIETRRLSIILQ